MKSALKNNIPVSVLFLIFFIIGCYTFRDYGIGIEEHFQRKSGFYWLNFILNYFNFGEINEIASLKLNEIISFTPNLFDIKKFPFYGVLFDLPLAFLETLLNIKEPQNYFYLRHIANFIIFLISGLFFYALLKKRFKNIYIPLFGFVFFIIAPRMYGNSFFDGKDIFFLSIFTINFYFYFSYVNNPTIKKLIFFALFCAFTTSTRIIGILLPLSFVFIFFLKSLSGNNKKILLKHFIIFIFSYFFLLYMHWPYLWTLDLTGYLHFFDPFFYSMNPTVFFNGEFYKSQYLPIYYLPLWILITTPVYYLILFLIGIYLKASLIFNRLLSIEENYKITRNDLWIGKNEEVDVLVFLNLFLILILYLSVNLVLLSGWRHFYYLNFFIVYFSCFSINFIFEYFKNKKIIKRVFMLFLIIFTIELIYKLYIYHPHQSSYFNNLATKNFKKKFEIDTQALSRIDAIKTILKDSKNKSAVKIGTASWTPLEDARSLIKKELWEKLIFTGTSNKKDADYIFTNHYYEVNSTLNKKYEIPKNFYLFKNLVINGTHIYSLYKKQI